MFYISKASNIMYIKIYISAKYMSMYRASILLQSRRRKSKLLSKISYVYMFKHILNYIVACQVEVRTVGILNMRCSNSASKLTIQKANFLILRQLTQNLTQVHSNVVSLTLPFHELSS